MRPDYAVDPATRAEGGLSFINPLLYRARREHGSTIEATARFTHFDFLPVIRRVRVRLADIGRKCIHGSLMFFSSGHVCTEWSRSSACRGARRIAIARGRVPCSELFAGADFIFAKFVEWRRAERRRGVCFVRPDDTP